MESGLAASVLGHGESALEAEVLELGADVGPLTHLGIGDKGGLAPAAALGLTGALRGVVPPGPETEPGGEVGVGRAEAGVLLVGLGGLVEGTEEGFVAGEGGDDGEGVAEVLFALGGEEDAGETRFEREGGESAADAGEAPALGFVGGFATADGAEFEEFAVTFANGGAGGRLQEGEVLDTAKAVVGHGEDNAGQGGALDFGGGVSLAASVVLLRVEADAGTGADAAAAAHALAGGGLADGLHAQGLDVALGGVAFDTGEAGVDDGADAGDGDGGLGDVGGQDDAAVLRGTEGAGLFAGREARQQGQALGARQVAALQKGHALADVAFAGEEDQDVAALRTKQVDGVGHAAGQVVVLRVFLGEPEGLDGEESTGDGDNGRAVEEVGEALGVKRGGGDDDAEVGAARQGALEQTEQEVDVERTLVGLVDDEGGITTEERVVARLGQQDAVGHQLEPRLLRGLALETVLIPHCRAQRCADFLGQTASHGDGRQTPRLGDADHPAGLWTGQVRELGKLGSLAAARIAADNRDGTLAERLNQFVRMRGNGQFWRDSQAIHAENYSKIGSLEV